MSQWFRLYESLLDDPKVQRLKPDVFKAWVNMLALASRHDGILPEIMDIGFALRVSEEKAAEWVTMLLSAGLLDRIDDDMHRHHGHYAPHNWASRQFKSDGSAERMRRHRDKSRNVTSDVTVTPSESESDTESETEQSRTEQREATPPSTQERSGDDKPFKLTNDWRPSDAGESHAVGKGLDLEATVEEFLGYFVDGRGKSEKRTASGWERRWRIWCNRNAGEHAKTPQRVRSQRRTSELAAFARGAARVGGDEPL